MQSKFFQNTGLAVYIYALVDKGARKPLNIRAFTKPLNEDAMASLYLQASERVGGIPVRLVTDHGVENGAMARLHRTLRYAPL